MSGESSIAFRVNSPFIFSEYVALAEESSVILLIRPLIVALTLAFSSVSLNSLAAMSSFSEVRHRLWAAD